MIKFTNPPVNRVEFIKHHAWYLSVVEIHGKKSCFWSFHDRRGLTDEKAKNAFEYEHLQEVRSLINKQIKLN